MKKFLLHAVATLKIALNDALSELANLDTRRAKVAELSFVAA